MRFKPQFSVVLQAQTTAEKPQIYREDRKRTALTGGNNRNQNVNLPRDLSQDTRSLPPTKIFVEQQRNASWTAYVGKWYKWYTSPSNSVLRSFWHNTCSPYVWQVKALMCCKYETRRSLCRRRPRRWISGRRSVAATCRNSCASWGTVRDRRGCCCSWRWGRTRASDASAAAVRERSPRQPSSPEAVPVCRRSRALLLPIWTAAERNILPPRTEWRASIEFLYYATEVPQWKHAVKLQITMPFSQHDHHRWTAVHPVLTATSQSNGNGQTSTPHRIKTLWPITIKLCTIDYVHETNE